MVGGWMPPLCPRSLRLLVDLVGGRESQFSLWHCPELTLRVLTTHLSPCPLHSVEPGFATTHCSVLLLLGFPCQCSHLAPALPPLFPRQEVSRLKHAGLEGWELQGRGGSG